MTTTDKNLPSYEQLFGNLNFKVGDEARSVYSPAAYLTDLIQLLQDYFESPDDGSEGDGNPFDLDARRSDIKDILLDDDNTFTQIPNLDIVNDILRRKIEGPNSPQDALELLKTQIYPLNLPLNFDYERLKKFLGYLNVREGEIQDLFSLTTDLDRHARNILGLSAEEVSYFVQDRSADERAIRAAFNLVINQDLNVKPGANGTGTGSKPALATVSQFLLTTGLSGKELRELLFQNLSITAVNAANLSERVLATNFFINQGLGGFTTLSADESMMIWQPAESPAAAGSQPEIPISWFGRCDRYIRLARKTGYSFSDLDLVLRNCCGNQLNRESLQVMALIKKLQVDYQLPVDVICAFFSTISTTGIGDLDEPGDLFNRTFNNRLAFLEKKYIAQSEFIPQSYILKIGQTDANRLTIMNDILQDESKEFRKRLQRTLQISDADLMLIIAKFRARNALDPTYTTSVNNNIQLPGLSLIFRMVKLAEILDLSIAELFDLFDLLELDRTMRTSSHFRILFPYPVQELNCYRIIDDPRTYAREALWLVQILIAIASWMRTTDFSTADLKFIQSGNLSSAEHATLSNTLIQMLDQLVQAFLPLALNPGTFVSDQFDARSSRVIYETLFAHDSLVSVQDNRIVRFDENAARRAAESALARLGGVTKKDFKGLNISGKMADKMYRNLVIYEFINADGEIVADKLPADVGDFSIATDFSDQRSSLFNIVHDLVVAEQSNFLAASDSDQLPDKQELGVMLYISDLAPLNLSLQQVNELMDNLIFNSYLDEEGNLSDPTFFADSENEDEFEVNTPLTRDHARIVFELIQKRMADFLHTPFKLESSIFNTLPLSDVEVQDLIANLKFNGYIDDTGMVIDKQIFFNLPQKKFKLAPEFYWYQGPILEAIQAALDADRIKYYHIDSETLADIAEEIVAEMGFNAVQAEYLEDGTISESQRDFFANPDNSATFDLGRYFTPGFNPAVFAQLAAIQQWFDRHYLTDKALAALGLDPNAIANLYSLLAQDGFLDTDHSIPLERYAYFLTVNNALTFSISGYDDYNKDIFFALQGVAKDMQQRQDEIVTALKGVAANQESAVMDTLAGGFEIDSESIRIICGYLFYNPRSLAEVLLVPALASVGPDGRVSALPGEYDFDRQLLRIAQFVHLAKNFQFGAGEVEVAFSDQNLVEKFPEDLVLPTGMTSFDALLPELDGKIYLFKGNQYWAYSSATYALVENAAPLALLSRLFAGLDHIDAAFTDPMGNAWIISGTSYFVRNKGSNTWTPTERRWGLVNNNFVLAGPIDAAFTNQDGVSYLFSGDQFIRYSGDSFTYVDPGFPKRISGHWPGEIGAEKLPDLFSASIDAGFESPDGQTILFKDDKFVRFDDSDPTAQEQDIASFWGRVFNPFSDLTHLDAAFSDGQNVYLFLDDFVIRYEDQVENDQVMMSEGFPRRLANFIPGLPEDFEYGIDAIFKGADNKVYAFTNNQFLVLSAAMDQVESHGDLVSKWGLVRNNIQTSGQIAAAFTGLDGYTYLFSGDQYFRYSGKDFTRVDEGFPRTIATDWGGLESITSAFILDGKTYLFAKGKAEYICYSTHDYSMPDANFPKPFDLEEYWNLPASLVTAGFSDPDAVLIGLDKATYLFKGKQFVAFDHLQRWWSQPQALASKWHDLEFDHIDAAFTGLDGKTYLFSGQQFVRYSDSTYSKMDDRYPRNISTHWGLVANNIAQLRRIDSAVVVDSRVMSVDASGNQVETTTRHTYLFSGNQFFRYAGTDYTFVEEGYPLTICTALQEEPRFKNLKAPWQGVVDAAFADERNVYLVQGNNLQIISDSASRSYDVGEVQIEAAVIDEGSLYFEEQGTWYSRNNPEMETTQQVEELPPILRDVPEFYQTGLSAILQGTDENTYLFKGPNCYDLLLHNAYPTGEAWGTVRNQIVEENRVEAAFLGQDGKTYLFCGDQFASYLPGTVVNMANNAPLIDGLPQPIADHWGGLTNVRYAYVQDGVTFLAEKPDEDGNFHIVRYSTADYSKPDKGYPRMVDFDWWEIPQSYQEDGFVRVDAVLTDEDNLFLIQGQEFIQFNYEMNLWTYARHLNLVWRGLAFNDDNFSSILAAFQGSDGLVYFFSQGAFAVVPHNIENPAPAGSAAPLLEIKLHWGHVDNHFADSGIVDAAFVWDGRETYLFSGPEYVKYSTNDYRHVDEGYPKLIWQSLRQEEPFAQLPDTFESTMQSLAAQGKGLSAAVANKGSVYLFINNTLLVVSKDLQRSYGIDVLGKMTNHIVENNAIDAAYVNAQGQLLLLAGDQVFKYSDPNFDSVDEGYPRKIREVALEEGFASIDPMFTYDLDAVLRAGTTGTIYLFKGQQYAGSDDPTTRKQINAEWGKVRNNFVPVGTATNMSVDAAFVSPNGMTYLFKGDQFIRYANFAQLFVDEGFPLPIRDNWGNLPAPYEAGIDGGFVFEGKTYLLRDEVIPGDGEYVRFSRPDYRKIDTIYPQKIADRAARWGDYLLGDIKLLSFFKQKVDETSSGSNSFTDFLNQKTVDQDDPYATLHAMFGWDISEVKWIQRNNAFLSVIDPEETRFDLEIIERMTQIFDTTHKLGADPSKVYAEVWQNWFDLSRPTDVKTAADNLYRYLANKTSATDWATLQQQIHDELNLIQRDILIPLSIALDPSLTRPKDLYDLLLIDVLMGSQARTSKVKEAISALQLYFHRYFVNLEQAPGSSPAQDPQTRELLKGRWKWLKNYRVWEANRMVFLYPENYIRPELRSTKTPQFKDLESALLQGELNLDTAEAAFTSYLEDLGIVSNLKIAGANVYEVGDFQNGGEKVLVLFGHTRMEPRQYYYRTASYAKQAQPNTDDLVVWSPWEKVDQTIDSDRVFPIMVNGRLMVFWIEIKDIEEPEAKFKSKQATETTSQETISQVNVAQKKLLHQAEIKYSLRKHDAKWTPPQQTKKGIDLVYKIDAAYCEGDNDSVIVTFCGEYCQKTRQDTQEVEAKRIEEFDEFKNLPESFKSGINAATVFKGKRYLFKGGQCVVQETTGQALQSLSIGDLIVKDPNAALLTVSPGTYGTDQFITDQSGDNLQKAEVLLSEGVRAAFGLTADILTLVDTQGHYSFYQEQHGKLYPMSSLLILSLLVIGLESGVTTLFFPQMISTLTLREGQFRPPDAVFKQGQTFYVIRDGQYECYNQVGYDLVLLDGFPKPLRGNLNFNMDNFFNHLHLENSHDLVFLSYTSPKDQLLLYGKLKADFTFQEIPIQSDRALLMVLGWNTLLQNNVRDYSPYRSVAIASSVSEFIANFTAQRGKIAAVLAVEAAIAQLKEALDSAQQIRPQETKATTNDGHLRHTLRRANGSWTGLGDVQSQFAIPGPVTVVAATGDGVAGQTQYMFATADGHLWHTLQRPDGSWAGLGDVQGQFAIPGPVTVVAATGDGVAGQTQYMFATADGHLWHTIRRADGSWTGLEDVQGKGKITIPGPVTAVAAAFDGTAGQTQYMFATADGHLWHTIRHADGSWQPLGDVQSVFAIPGPVTVVAATGDGITGETQYMFATNDGHLWHTLRRADGSWTGLEDVQSKITIPGPVTAVAAAFDGTAGQTQYMFATNDGHLWHTIRHADGTWQPLGDVQSVFAIPGPVTVVAATGDGTAGETQYMFATADGQDVPAVDQLEIKIQSNLQAISNVLAPFQNQGTLLTEINTLLGFVPALGPAIDQVKAAKARQKQKTLDALSGVINTGQQIVTQTNDAITAITPGIQGEIATEVQSVEAYSLTTILPDAASHVATYQSFKNFLTVIQGSIPVWGSLLGSSNDGSSDDNQLQSILAGATSMILAGTNQIVEFEKHNEAVRSDSSNAITTLGNIGPNSPLSTTADLLDAAISQLGMVENEINSRSTVLGEVNLTHQQILGMATGLVKAVKEQLLGTFDLFPPQFGVANTSNFSFSPQLLNGNTSNFSFSSSSGPNWYCFEAKDGAFLCRPLDGTPGASQDPQYEIIRLTTTVTPRLSSILFAQGIKGLLSVTTQQEDEAPSFDPGPGSVQFNRNPGSKFLKGLASDGTSVYNVPVTDTLDFHGASGIYYEELFFHAPFLIAQTLNTAQKFEEAKMWYEFIFDPTQVDSPWNYLPFRTTTEDGHFLIDQNQIKRYLDDPFDPHAIAALRPTAYQKAIVMSYIDNLLDWGDMLFRQYAAESIDEARMLYTLAFDLLGERPEDLGTMVLSPPKKLVELAITREYSGEYEFVVQPAGDGVPSNLIGDEPITIRVGTPNDSVGLRYFFVPENGVFLDYWMRVADRLFKIRNSLNIDGQAQPLPLFEPPINPMALVQAVARGLSLEQLISGLAVTVPAYRFEFLAARAQNLAQKLIQYGNELLSTLEKKDAEALSQMQTRQEGDILKMTIDIYQAQIDEAEQTILNLEESQRSAQQRIQLYQQWITNGRLPEEISQIALLSAATALQYVSSVLKIGATIAHATPNANLGPFIIGVTEGGSNVGNSLNSAADVVQAVGQGLSMTGEILGTQAQFKRTVNDWDLQLKIAQSEDRQIGYQLSGARIAKLSAEYNMAVLRKQIEQNQSIQTFLKEKFSSQDLYLWMISQTAGLYYQTYQIAFETARMAEKAFQFERGLQEQEASFITGGYWDSQRKGLLAGEKLTLDLDRMEQAFVKTDERRLEITREVSLLELDALAFLRLKLKGSCEFSLDEAFFDYDFPGHYARQIKTIAVEFDVPNGKTVYATLTQLSHQTVLQPDPKAVKFLLAPKDEPPATIRSNWRSSQQVALSHHDQYQKNNGMFELNYNSDRYLPFEGTGAVSRWKLELGGKKGSIDLRELVDVTIHLEYTARQGGAVFAQAVKGTLKPYQAMRFFDFIYDYPQEWKDFLDGDSTVLTLTFTRDQFPGMSSSKISGIFTHYNLGQPDDQASTILNGNDTWVLTENAYLDTTGLSIGPKGSDLTFEYRGDKKTLQNIQLVFSYTASVS